MKETDSSFFPHKLAQLSRRVTPHISRSGKRAHLWDFAIPGSFSDLVTQFPRESERRVYSRQRRSPRGGEGLRLGPISLSPTAGQGRGSTGCSARLAGSARHSRERPGAQTLASAVPPQPASGSLTAVGCARWDKIS